MAIDAVKRFRDAVADEPALKNTQSLEDLRERLLKQPLSFLRALLRSDRDTRPESLDRLATNWPIGPRARMNPPRSRCASKPANGSTLSSRSGARSSPPGKNNRRPRPRETSHTGRTIPNSLAFATRTS